MRFYRSQVICTGGRSNTEPRAGRSASRLLAVADDDDDGVTLNDDEVLAVRRQPDGLIGEVTRSRPY